MYIFINYYIDNLFGKINIIYNYLCDKFDYIYNIKIQLYELILIYHTSLLPSKAN